MVVYWIHNHPPKKYVSNRHRGKTILVQRSVKSLRSHVGLIIMFRDGLDFKSSPFQFQVQYGIRQLVTLSNILQTLYINDYKMYMFMGLSGDKHTLVGGFKPSETF